MLLVTTEESTLNKEALKKFLSSANLHEKVGRAKYMPVLFYKHQRTCVGLFQTILVTEIGLKYSRTSIIRGFTSSETSRKK